MVFFDSCLPFDGEKEGARLPFFPTISHSGAEGVRRGEPCSSARCTETAPQSLLAVEKTWLVWRSKPYVYQAENVQQFLSLCCQGAIQFKATVLEKKIQKPGSFAATASSLWALSDWVRRGWSSMQFLSSKSWYATTGTSYRSHLDVQII